MQLVPKLVQGWGGGNLLGHICRIHAVLKRFGLRPFRFAVRLACHIMTDDYFRTFFTRTSQGGDKYGAELPFIRDLTSIILRLVFSLLKLHTPAQVDM